MRIISIIFFGLPGWHFISWKISYQIVPLVISAIVASLVCRYIFKKDVNTSLIYSVFTFFCLIPINTAAIEVFSTFLLGSLLSLGKLRIKSHLFYLNPAVAARLLVFLLHVPIVHIDAISGATPLAYCHIMLETGRGCHSLPVSQLLIGQWQGALGETSKIGIIVGGVILVVFRLVRIRVIASGLLGAAVSWLLLYYGAGYYQLPGLFSYLLMGSLLFGLIFMTTDLFTRELNHTEYTVYSFLVGFICIILRVITPFPETTLLSLIIS